MNESTTYDWQLYEILTFLLLQSVLSVAKPRRQIFIDVNKETTVNGILRVRRKMSLEKIYQNDFDSSNRSKTANLFHYLSITVVF